MKIPFFGNDREYRKYQDLLTEASRTIWKTGQYLNGPAVKEFELKLSNYCQRKYAVALGSCTDALTFALHSLQLPKDSEVLVTSFSFLASATAILRADLKPVFCDVDPETAMVTAESLSQKLSKKTKAVIVVSLYGNMAPMSEIKEFCENNNLIMIEDAAQSFGATLRNEKAGSFGKASAISFDPTKTLHGTGSGGALLLDDEEMYQHVLSLRLHGRTLDGEFTRLGHKSLLPTHDAAIMNLKLDLLDQWNTKRNSIAVKYDRALESQPTIIPIRANGDVFSTYHKYVIRCKNSSQRTNLKNYLEKAGITTRIHYSKTIPQELLFSHHESDHSNAIDLTQNVLSLPIFHELTDEEIHYICKQIESF